jgi:hypothetical protein
LANAAVAMMATDFEVRELRSRRWHWLIFGALAAIVLIWMLASHWLMRS